MDSDSPFYVMGGTQPQYIQSMADMAAAVAVVDTYPVKLVDVSKWQGVIDFVKMRSQAQAVYIRAGYGNDGIDPNCRQNVIGARAAGMPFGLYWFVKVGESWREHIDSFWELVQELKPSLPPVFDCEYTTVSKADGTAWMEKLYSNWMTTTKVAPIIYTRASWWDTNLARQDWPKNCLLWVAHYTNAAQPALPDDWEAVANPRTWTFWQWSADGNNQGPAHGVSSEDIDRNRFQGTVEDFNKLFGTQIKALGTPVEPPERNDPIKPLKLVKVATQLLNVRAGPGTNYADIGDLHTGDVAPVTGSEGDWYKIEGYIYKPYTRDV